MVRVEKNVKDLDLQAGGEMGAIIRIVRIQRSSTNQYNASYLNQIGSYLNQNNFDRVVKHASANGS